MKILTKFKLILLVVILLLPFFVLAQQVPQNTITNPSPNFFVDFANRGGNTFANLILFVITRILLPLVGIVAVLFIIIGGFQYITSGANQEMAESGKKTLKNAIIGLAIAFLSYVLVIVVINAFTRLN